MNLTTAFIDFFAKIGWAYDLKTVSSEIIQKRVDRTGDQSSADERHSGRLTGVWGWGDKDQDQEEKKMASIIHKKED